MYLKNFFIKGHIQIINMLLLLFFIRNRKSQTIDCKRDIPILISGECKLNYCSEYQFISSKCLIANSIVKTQ